MIRSAAQATSSMDDAEAAELTRRVALAAESGARVVNSAEKLAVAARRIEAARDAAAVRDAELTRNVSVAKGRIDMKPDVQLALERLQEDAYRNTVGRYESLLTALVKDVIDPHTRIKIELEIKRGKPFLSIWSHIDDVPEFKSGVYENSGGMTNVVEVGLRLIATAKAGGRRFLLLDEPDCWISESLASKFYSVLRDLCAKQNYQILVISHKPERALTGCRIQTLAIGGSDYFDAPEASDQAEVKRGRRSKKKELPREVRTAIAMPQRGGTDWSAVPPDRPGVRSIAIKHLATLKDVEIELDPYLTVINGEPNTGKSRFTRALRAAFYGEVSDGDIRYGSDGLEVRVKFEGDVSLTFSRAHGRQFVNAWRLADADDNPLYCNGAICDGGYSDGVPSWLGPMLGIVTPENLPLQISHQKKSAYLLELDGAQQAALLSVGQEIKYLSDMQITYKDRLLALGKIVRQGEIEITGLRASLQRWAGIENINRQLSDMVESAQPVAGAPAQIRPAMTLAGRIGAGEVFVANTARRVALLSAIPSPPALPDGMAANAKADAISTSVARLAVHQRRATGLANLPAAPDVDRDLRRVVAIEPMARSIEAESRSIRRVEKTVGLLRDRLPDMVEIQGHLAQVDKARLMFEFGAKISSDRIQAIAYGRRSAIMANLPTPPDIAKPAEVLRGIDKHIGAIQSARHEADLWQGQRIALDADYTDTISAYNKLVDEAGGECPLCHSGLSHDHHQAPNTHLLPAAPARPLEVSVPAVPPIGRTFTPPSFAGPAQTKSVHQTPAPQSGQAAQQKIKMPGFTPPFPTFSAKPVRPTAPAPEQADINEGYPTP